MIQGPEEEFEVVKSFRYVKIRSSARLTRPDSKSVAVFVDRLSSCLLAHWRGQSQPKQRLGLAIATAAPAYHFRILLATV